LEDAPKPRPPTLYFNEEIIPSEADSQVRYVRKVMSSIAVFLILGDLTTAAVKKIGSNEIKGKGNSITTGKIKKEAVAAAKIKNSAVTTNKIANNL
jgi:hypothetical protein